MNAKLSLIVLFNLLLYGNTWIIAQTTSQAFAVRGTITDNRGEPLQGVRITMKDSKIAAVSDNKGDYQISLSRPSGVLVFSMMGFTEQEKTVEAGTVVNIVMRESVNNLDEVVVIGYGEQLRSDLTGALTGIKAEDIERSANPDLLGALQGKMPGARINSQSGEPGAEMNIQIRGANSLYGASTPLFVIDGVPFDVSSDEVATAYESNIGNSANPLSSLNPSDIESIEILKDASATAIYGSRGANGVVIVTTKSGVKGKSDISYHGYVSYAQASRKLNLLNGDEWIDFQRETRPNSPLFYEIKDGLVDTNSPVDPYRFAQHDWQDEAFRWAATQNHYLSFSGGSDKTIVAGGVGYLKQEGIIRSNGMDRYNVRLRMDHSQNSKLKLGLNVLGSYQELYGATNTGLVNSANGIVQRIIMSRPIAFYDPSTDDDVTRYITPLSMLDDAYKNTGSMRANASAYLEYQFSKALKLHSTASGVLSSSKGKEFYSKYTTMGNMNNGVAVLQERRTHSWNSTTRLNYLKTFNRIHRLDVMAAFEASRYSYESQRMRSIDFVDESTGINDISKGAQVSGVSSTRWANNRVSWLTRANYSLAWKYLFTASFRIDGSDKFGPGNRYGYFPSAAFAWQVHKEDFIKSLNTFDQLKLRLSYGETGNERIPAYRYFSEMVNAYYASAGSNIFGMAPGSAANPDLKWETTVQYNAGLDVGILKNRLTFTADYYIKQTKDMLLPAYVPSELGYSQQWKNMGRIDNHGVEFQVTSINIDKAFRWSTSFNISANKNIIKSLGDIDFIPVIMNNGAVSNLGRVQVGNSLGTGYGYLTDGVYQIDDFTWQNNSDPNISHGARQYTLKSDVVSVAGATVSPGSLKYKDLSGDNMVDEENDRTFISRSLPKHYGGFDNTFSYKNLECNIFFEWSYGGDMINLGTRLIQGPSGVWNLSKEFWDNHWTPQNPTNVYPDVISKNATAAMMSDYYVEDASYLRLRNISLSYKLPQKTVSRMGLKTLSVYTTATNLHVWTKYSSFDPDVSYSNPLLPGLERLAYPRARSFLLGLKASL